MTTQTTPPDAVCVLSDAFIPFWHKSTLEHKRNDKDGSNYNSIKHSDFKKQAHFVMQKEINRASYFRGVKRDG